MYVSKQVKNTFRFVVAPLCIVLLLTGIFFLRSDETNVAEAAWYDSNWDYRIAVTINASKVPTEKVVYLTTGSTWTVPADWNSSSNLIETVGGGGDGSDRTGGGGGAYSNISNQSLTSGNSVGYAVGGIQGDTYFCNNTSNCGSIGGSAVIVGAKGGISGWSTGAGGSAASGVGTVKTSGGDGGSGSSDAGAGGGGAGGPDADGGDGGNGSGFTGGSGGNANGVSGTGGVGGTNQNKGERGFTNGGISGGGGGGSGHDDSAGDGGNFGGGGGAKGNDASGSDADGSPGGIKITYSSTSTLTDFPVYVDLSDLPQHVWDNMRSDCGDLRITSSNGSTEAAREIVSCNSSAQTGELHFKAATLTSASDNTFYIYYGNSGQADYAIDATYGAENVWTNGYQAVYHFESNSSLVDSTSNDRDGTVTGTVSTTTGKLSGSSYDFAGSDDFATTTNDFSLSASDHSVQFWFNADAVGPDADSSNAPTIVAFRGQYDYFFTFGDSAAGDSLGLRYTDGTWQTAVSAPDISTDTWYQWTSTFSTSSGQTLFLNGSLTEADGDTGSISTQSSYANIIGGIQPTGSTGRSFDGSVDELRVSSVARSKAWVEVEYNNQSSPSTFYSMGGVGEGDAQRVYLTSGTSWSVPSDWYSASNTIEVIGGGGGGSSYIATDGGYGGGGGGAYSKATNVSLTAGGTVTYAVGSGGGAGTAGGDTYICNSTSNCASIVGSAVVVGAKGGSGATSGTGASGGAAGSGVGSTKYSGGSGGSGSSGGTPWGGGGGGGGAGPSGNGASGGNGGNQGGGGGGGAGGGTAGTGGASNNGGAGGNNSSGSGGGSGGTSGVDGSAGSDGGGGGGGYGGSPNTNGGNGGAGIDWSASYGAGGGGGASGDAASAKTPGSGGLYGGGGGGAAADSGTTGGSGAQGLIVITYTAFDNNVAPETPSFLTPPDDASDTSVTMVATTTDTTGYAETENGILIEYYFTNDNASCGSNAGTGGSDSGWIATSTYTDIGLQANKCYGYTITARDGFGGVSATSTASSTYTTAATPGAPTVAPTSDTTLALTNDANGNPAADPITLFAMQVGSTSPTDATWDGKYIDSNGDPSGTAVWLSDSAWDAIVIQDATPDTNYPVRVKARNEDEEETPFGSTGEGTTTSTPVEQPRLRGGGQLRGGVRLR